MRARFALTAALVAGSVLVGAACSGDDAPSTEGLSPEAAKGAELVQTHRCTTCHRTGTDRAAGPGWGGLAGSERELSDGSTVVADGDYLRRAITDPSAEVAAGFANAMPSFDLSDEELDAIVAYLESLADS